MDNHTVNNFVDILRDLIKEQIDKQDTTIMCKIVSVNQDGTYNVYVEPDERNIIHNIPSISPYTLKQDDYVYVYKIKNQLNNSFIIKRLGSDGALDTIPTKNEVISLIEEYTEKYNKTIQGDQGDMILQPATNTTLGGVKASVTNETAEEAYGTKVYPIVISNGTIYGKEPVLTVVSSTENGLMTSTDKSKLDGIEANANNYTHPAGSAADKSSGLYKFSTDSTSHIKSVTAVSKADITGLGIPAQDTTYSTATDTAAGLVIAGTYAASASHMFGAYAKTYAIGVSTNGVMYGRDTTYSTATSTTAGLVKVGYATSGKNYAVQLSDGKMYVNVPWTDNDTTYSAVTASRDGLMTSTDKSKLDGIANNANNYIHPTYTSKASGLYKVTVDGTGHVSAATAVSKADITALGIPGSDTNTHYTTKMYATSSTGTINASTVNGDTYLRLFDDSTARSSIKIVGEGATQVYSLADGTIKIKSTDNNTTYSTATTTENGLMSTAMVTKLNGIATDATADSAITSDELATILV